MRRSPVPLPPFSRRHRRILTDNATQCCPDRCSPFLTEDEGRSYDWLLVPVELAILLIRTDKVTTCRSQTHCLVLFSFSCSVLAAQHPRHPPRMSGQYPMVVEKLRNSTPRTSPQATPVKWKPDYRPSHPSQGQPRRKQSAPHQPFNAPRSLNRGMH